MPDTLIPAFPQTHFLPDGGSVSYYGVSLRDYFAAKAMAALIISPLENWPEGVETLSVSAVAYLLADKMLEARNA